jgi:hypothetical protein
MHIGRVKVDVGGGAVGKPLKDDGLRFCNVEEFSKLMKLAFLMITNRTDQGTALPGHADEGRVRHTFAGNVPGTRSDRGSLSFFWAP